MFFDICSENNTSSPWFPLHHSWCLTYIVLAYLSIANGGGWNKNEILIMQGKNQIKILGICVNSSRKKYCQTRDLFPLHLQIHMYHENIIEATSNIEKPRWFRIILLGLYVGDISFLLHNIIASGENDGTFFYIYDSSNDE